MPTGSNHSSYARPIPGQATTCVAACLLPPEAIDDRFNPASGLGRPVPEKMSQSNCCPCRERFHSDKSVPTTLRRLDRV
ncbi:unnamed protein product [Protopolystoma xenopodis]|uniref:Uncharacterized protein n=1 Tax=Protopolystoma xenopodis TaxID=117903 RepID=A0A3S5A185_9PLAT|nr:unnamed protein product [Protopolystoma xenopodis]